MIENILWIFYYNFVDFRPFIFDFRFRKAFLNDVIRSFGLIDAAVNAEDGFNENFFSFAMIPSCLVFALSTRSGMSKHFNCPSSDRTHTRKYRLNMKESIELTVIVQCPIFRLG